MSKTNKYSPEVRERAIRLVQEVRKDRASLWAAVEIDSGVRNGVPAAERKRIKALKREVKELSQATKSCGWPVRFSRGGARR